MLLIALLLILIFAGAGAFVHVLWWGLLLGGVLLVARALTGSRGP